MIAADLVNAENLVAVLWRMACYNTELSASDFATAYAAGTFGTPPGSPSTFWKMDDGSGTTVADFEGANNGTIAGDVTWTTHT